MGDTSWKSINANSLVDDYSTVEVVVTGEGHACWWEENRVG